MSNLANTAVGFDESACPAFYSLTDGDTRLLMADNNGSTGTARSQWGTNKTRMAVEFYFYTLNGIVAPNPLLGVCGPQATLTGILGSDAYGWAYDPSTGNITNAGATVATFVTAPPNSFIGVTVDPVNSVITWYLNGVPIGSVITTGITSWYYASSISGIIGDMIVWANAGQTPFRFPMALAPGWVHPKTGIVPFFDSSEPYISATTDVIPSSKYKGNINRVSNPPKIPRAVRFWMWGDSAPSSLNRSGQIQIPIDDPLQQMNQLMTLDIRDQRIDLSRVWNNDTLANGEGMFTGIMDHCEQPTLQTKLLFCNDLTSLLDSQPYRPIFPPNVDPSAAGKPRPISIGICRTFAPQFWDPTTFAYGVSDAAIAAIGKARMNGKEMALGVDFFLNSQSDGCTLPAAANGKFTLETSDYGGTITTSSSDSLAGDGNFLTLATNDGGGTTGGSSTTGLTATTGSKTLVVNIPARHGFTTGCAITVLGNSGLRGFSGTVTSYNSGTGSLVVNATAAIGSGTITAPLVISQGVNQPHNWTGCGGYVGQDIPNTMWQLGGVSPNKYVNVDQNASSVYSLQHQTKTVVAGGIGVVAVTVFEAPYNGPGVDSNNNPITIEPAQLVVGGDSAGDNLGWISMRPWSQKVSIPKPGTYNIYYYNNSGQTKNLTLGFLQNNMIQGTGGVFSHLKISKIIAVDLPALTQNVNLAGPGLEVIVRQIICDRGPLTTAQYDNASAAAIDTATGYLYGLHVGSDSSPTVDQMLTPVLQSAGCDRFQNRGGAISIVQIAAPENLTPIGYLNITDQKGDLQPYEDLAENLTTRMEGCPNYDPYADADFGDQSTGDVPPQVRALLVKDYQWTVTSSVAVANRYFYARRTDPLKTQFDRSADGLAEITRICSIYASPRNFYVGMFHTRIGRNFEIGQIWNVQNKYLPTLAAGQNLMLVGIEDCPTEGYATLTFWGL